MALSTAAPTEWRHANAIFSGVVGALRMSAASASGTKWRTGSIDSIIIPFVILASASPRRADLLRAAGIPFDVRVANVDERVRPGEEPDAYVIRLATEKAAAVAAEAPGHIVLAADTAVVIDRHILGKPVDVDDARRMLRLLSGRTHEVITGVCLDGESRLERTEVEMMPMTEDEIAWYVGTGEPMDKAGGYAVQGLASRFVTRIAGSYSNVVGLPVALVYQLLQGAMHRERPDPHRL